MKLSRDDVVFNNEILRKPKIIKFDTSDVDKKLVFVYSCR